jgi:hypothetical protein
LRVINVLLPQFKPFVGLISVRQGIIRKIYVCFLSKEKAQMRPEFKEEMDKFISMETNLWCINCMFTVISSQIREERAKIPVNQAIIDDLLTKKTALAHERQALYGGDELIKEKIVKIYAPIVKNHFANVIKRKNIDNE